MIFFLSIKYALKLFFIYICLNEITLKKIKLLFDGPHFSMHY